MANFQEPTPATNELHATVLVRHDRLINDLLADNADLKTDNVALKDALTALQTKVGTNASDDPNSIDFRVNDLEDRILEMESPPKPEVIEYTGPLDARQDSLAEPEE